MTEQRNPIFDIAPVTETVTINGVDHKVYGVPSRILAQLGKDYPELVAMLMGGGLNMEAIKEKFAPAVQIIIAAGFRGHDDPEVRKFAADLPLDTQMILLAAILKRTMMGGPDPFGQAVKAIVNMGAAEEPRIFRLKAAQKDSSKPSASSVPTTDGQQEKFGT